MLLIFTNRNDVFTNRVLALLTCQYVIIYHDDILQDLTINSYNSELEIKLVFINKTVKLNRITYIWHRRGNINLEKFFTVSSQLKPFIYLGREIRQVGKFISSFLKSIDHLSLPNNEFENNKLVNLCYAKKVGFKVPNWLVSTTRDSIGGFIKNSKRSITKGIYSLFEYYDGKVNVRLGTIRVTEDDLLSLNPSFLPTFVQDEIIKAYEVRCFYMLSNTYSIAIMSQENIETSLDYRNYDVFTRIQSIRIPQEIENNLIKLMNALNLKIGVIDFIVDKKGEYYFLEINPTGQLMRISETGNYNLDQIIAGYFNSKLKK